MEKEIFKGELISAIPLFSIFFERSGDDRLKRFMVNLFNEVCQVKFEMELDIIKLRIDRRNGKKREIIKSIISAEDKPEMYVQCETGYSRTAMNLIRQYKDNSFRDTFIDAITELCQLNDVDHPKSENIKILYIGLKMGQITHISVN